MNSFKVLAMVCLVVAKARSSPIPQPQPQPQTDLFAGFLRNVQLGAPAKESDIVKRRIFEDNPDRELKQISLNALIGDLENSLFASAASVHKVINDKTAEIHEIRPVENDNENKKKLNKRHLAVESTTTEVPTTTTTAAPSGEARKVILQTTEKVPESNGVPAHIVIDRIAIQPHTGSVSLIPTFEIKRTSNSDNPSEITKISISKTEISAVPNTTATPSSTVASTTAETETTTANNKEHLKEVEEELKEKVAEIEADPVILSARV